MRSGWTVLPVTTALWLAAGAGGVAEAQTRGVAPESELFKKVAALDAAVFDAYNRCELTALGALFAEDVEFYHDQNGLSRGRAALVQAVKDNICHKVQRALVPGTLQVHEMKGYGALEIGVHRFHQPAVRAEATGEAQFVHLWQNRDGVWQITRVISYDHRALK
jgi:ketosteroid isomerase-like protein